MASRGEFYEKKKWLSTPACPILVPACPKMCTGHILHGSEMAVPTGGSSPPTPTQLCTPIERFEFGGQASGIGV